MGRRDQKAYDRVLAVLPPEMHDVLNGVFEESESELDDMKAEMEELRDEIEQRDSDQDRALETVKYAFIDTMVHGRPMRRPTELLRIVEDALR